MMKNNARQQKKTEEKGKLLWRPSMDWDACFIMFTFFIIKKNGYLLCEWSFIYNLLYNVYNLLCDCLSARLLEYKHVNCEFVCEILSDSI